MNVFSTRKELIDFIESHIVYGYIKRAIREGEIENYGAFEVAAVGHKEPGWVLKVTSTHKRVVYVSIVCGQRYRIIVSDEEPMWKYWVGGECANELYLGDHPDTYRMLRMKEIKEDDRGRTN